MPVENKATERRSVVNSPGTEERLVAIKATQVVWLLFGILEALIAIRIGFKLIGANPGNLVVRIVYGITLPFLWPFEGITITPSIGSLVLEIPSIIALLIYGLIAWIIERLIWVIFYRPKEPVETTTETTTREDRHP